MVHFPKVGGRGLYLITINFHSRATFPCTFVNTTDLFEGGHTSTATAVKDKQGKLHQQEQARFVQHHFLYIAHLIKKVIKYMKP